MSNNQAGKGDKIRKGADLQKYWDNYDLIFNKDKLKDKSKDKLKPNTTPDQISNI